MFVLSILYSFIFSNKNKSILLLLLFSVVKNSVKSFTTHEAVISPGSYMASSSYPLNTVKLGGIFIFRSSPMDFDVTGVQELAAFLMAINEINSKSDGFSDWLLTETQIKYSIRYVDQNYQRISASALDLSTNVFKGNGVDTCLLGTTYNSHLSSAIENLLNTFSSVNTPLISSSLSYPLFNDKSIYPNFFRTISSQSYQGYTAAKVISQLFGKTRISIFTANNKYCNYILGEFNIQSKLLDFTIASTHKISTQETINTENEISDELTAAVKLCKSHHSEIFIFFIDSPLIAITLLKIGIQLSLFKTTTQIIGINEISNNVTLSLIQKIIPNQNDILHSFIGMQPVRNTSEKQQQFLKRWQNQQYHQQSKSIFSATSNYCINITDSDGHNILKSYSSNALCNVYNIKNINDISQEALNMYDAVYAFAYNTHNIINNNTLSAIITTSKNLKSKFPLSLVQHTSFPGVSGDISFSTGTNNIKKYGYGDRYTGQTYQLLHYSQNKLLCNGYWNDNSGYISYEEYINENLNISPDFYYSNSQLITNVPYRSFTYDGITTKIDHISLYVKIIIMTLAAICMLIIVYYIRNVIKYSKIRILKASQPFMLIIILIGTLFACMYVIMSMLTPTTATCTLKTWFGHSSYFLVFGSLITKTWRINMIVNNGLKRVKVTKTQMIILISSLFGILIFYMILVSFVGIPYVYNSSSINGFEKIIEAECRLKQPILIDILYVAELLVMALGLRVCYIARMMPLSVNETTYILLAFYIIILLSIILYPMSILSLRLSVLDHIIFRQALTLIGVTVTFIIIYLPKAALLFGIFEVPENTHLVGATKSNIKTNKRTSKISSLITDGMTTPTNRLVHKEKFAIDTPKKIKPKKLTAAEAAAIAARMKVMNMTTDLGAVHDFPTDDDVAACSSPSTKKDNKSRISVETKPPLRGSSKKLLEEIGDVDTVPNGPPSPLMRRNNSGGNGISSVISPLAQDNKSNSNNNLPVSIKCFETVTRHANYRPSRDSLGKLTSFGENTEKE